MRPEIIGLIVIVVIFSLIGGLIGAGVGATLNKTKNAISEVYYKTRAQKGGKIKYKTKN